MRLISLCLVALLVLIQYPLWLGKGGWLRVWELERNVAAVRHDNDISRMRNLVLAKEVEDLKEGMDAIEERARHDLGMIKENEVFVQIVVPSRK